MFLFCFLNCVEVGVPGVFHVEGGAHVFLPRTVSAVKDFSEGGYVGGPPWFGMAGGSARGGVTLDGGHDLIEGRVEP